MDLLGETDFERALSALLNSQSNLLRETGKLLNEYRSVCIYSSKELVYIKVDKKWVREYVSMDFGTSFTCQRVSRLPRGKRLSPEYFEFEIALGLTALVMKEEFTYLRGYGVPSFDDLKLPETLGYRLSA